MPAEQYVGVDVGGTVMKAGIVSADGKVDDFSVKDTRPDEGREKVFNRLSGLIEETIGSRKVSGIGVGFPGPLDPQKGIVHFAPNIPDCIDIPLAAELEKRFGVPVFIENDAHMVAIGEKWLGAARGLSNFVLLTLGTGVGGAIFINDELFGGAGGFGGEIGHVTVNPFGRACSCGNIGCVEAHASAQAIVERYRELLLAGKRSPYSKSQADKLTFRAVLAAARDGDQLAIDILHDAACYLGIAVASLINIFNPEAILVAGGMAAAAEFIIPHIESEIDRRALAASSSNCELRLGELGDRAGVVGAGRWIQTRLETSA